MKQHRQKTIIASVAAALVLTAALVELSSSSRSHAINELRVCGEVFAKQGTPAANAPALIKLRFKSAQYAANAHKIAPFETIDNLSLGEPVKLDQRGRFCTSLIKLENFYRPSTTQLLSLSVTIGERTVEGYLSDGEIGGSSKNALHLFANFDFSKPFNTASSRFLTKDLQEMFGATRGLASESKAVGAKSPSANKSNQ